MNFKIKKHFLHSFYFSLISGRPENLEFHKEAQDLQSEAKCLQLSLEKVAQSLAALQLKTSENKVSTAIERLY